MANRPTDSEAGARTFTVTDIEDVATMSLTEFLSAAFGVLPPPRGSEDYREELENLMFENRGAEFIDSLRHLYGAYGWKGLADFQQQMLEQLHVLAARPLRDALNRVVLKRLVTTDMDEERVLRMAVELGSKPGAVEAGFDFATSYEYGRDMLAALRPFADTFQQCLDFLAQGQGDRVWPTLARMPQMRDIETHYVHVSQATMTLLLAVHQVQAPSNIRERLKGLGLPPLTEPQVAMLRRFASW